MEEPCIVKSAVSRLKMARRLAANVAPKCRQPMSRPQMLKTLEGGGYDSALSSTEESFIAQNQDYTSSAESNDSVERADTSGAISDKSQRPVPPPSQEPIELDSLATDSHPNNQDKESSEGITFVEKNQTADTAKKAKETIGKVWKKLPKKWLAIGAGAIVGICIVFAVVSSIMSQPLKLDASVTLDDVTFNYTSEWQLEVVVLLS